MFYISISYSFVIKLFAACRTLHCIFFQLYAVPQRENENEKLSLDSFALQPPPKPHKYMKIEIFTSRKKCWVFFCRFYARVQNVIKSSVETTWEANFSTIFNPKLSIQPNPFQTQPTKTHTKLFIEAFATLNELIS